MLTTIREKHWQHISIPLACLLVIGIALVAAPALAQESDGDGDKATVGVEKDKNGDVSFELSVQDGEQESSRDTCRCERPKRTRHHWATMRACGYASQQPYPSLQPPS